MASYLFKSKSLISSIYKNDYFKKNEKDSLKWYY